MAALERNGVDAEFGIPGVHNLEIYRHLAVSPIRTVAVRHEQGAGYAADGHARVSGRPAVCLTTSGPGATNACTALATAYADSVPVLFCSPGPPVGVEGLDLGRLHEMKDERAHFESLVSASIRPTSPEEVGDAVDAVFAGWGRARRRPFHLEVPVDVLEGTRRVAPDGGIAGGVRGTVVERLRAIFDSTGPTLTEDAGAAVARAGRMLSAARRPPPAARRPLVVLGGGATAAGDAARELAERLGALVVTTVNGKGTVAETHPLSLGASIRLPTARRLVESADVLVVVGSELGDSDLWGEQIVTTGDVVRIDIDPHQLDKNLVATVGICMDATAAIRRLLERLERPTSTRATSAARNAERIRASLRNEALVEGGPYVAINRALSSSLPGDTVVAGDSAQVSYFGTVHFWPMDRAGRFLYPTGYATLGYGLPAAIGAKIAVPMAPVVVLVGDGGFLFTVQELLTAVEPRLPLPVVIADNHGYAEIREGMERRGIAPVGVDRPDVDFAALSRAFGGRGYAVGDIDELCTRVRDALTADGPTVISIDVSDSSPA